MRVACLSGGVGGAKLACGLQDVLGPGELTVIGNVGDDVEVLGLHVSPDLDSVLYALAGLNDEERGWGRAGETWRALEAARHWGGEGWFMLGDLDLGLHLVRTQALRTGDPLSAVTARLAEAAGLATLVLPATDDPLRTSVVTPGGTFPFQEWFVARRHEDEVDAMVFAGADAARPAPGVLEAIRDADALVVAPSNPYTSIHPILAVDGIRETVAARRAAYRRRQPARRRPRRQGPARPYAHAHVGRHLTCACGAVLRGPDRRARDRSSGCSGRGGRPPRGHGHADDRPRRGSQARRGRARGGRVRVAVVGGTGGFGLALAKRLSEGGYDVVVGSRDAERAAAAAATVGVEGATNADACRAANLVILATKAEAAVATAAGLRDAIGTTPVLSVAAELTFGPDGVLPTTEATSVAARIQDVVDAPVVAGLHSLAARNLGGDAPPEEDALVCGDDADAKAVVLELAGRITSGRAIDCGPLASARSLEGLTAVIVNVNKRYKAHAGIRVTGVR